MKEISRFSSAPSSCLDANKEVSFKALQGIANIFKEFRQKGKKGKQKTWKLFTVINWGGRMSASELITRPWWLWGFGGVLVIKLLTRDDPEGCAEQGVYFFCLLPSVLWVTNSDNVRYHQFPFLIQYCEKFNTDPIRYFYAKTPNMSGKSKNKK